MGRKPKLIQPIKVSMEEKREWMLYLLNKRLLSRQEDLKTN